MGERMQTMKRWLMAAALAGTMLVTAACDGDDETRSEEFGAPFQGSGTPSAPANAAATVGATPAAVAATGTAAAGSTGASGAEPRRWEITATDFKFDRNELQARSQETLEVTLTNDGSTQHSWRLMGVVDAAGSAVAIAPVAPGDDGNVTFLVGKSGTYTFQCDIHPQQMTGRIILSG